MKKKISNIICRLLFLLIIPLFITIVFTGIHNQLPDQIDSTNIITLKHDEISEAISSDEYILGVTAGFLSDWDYQEAGSSELVKLYGVIINTYMKNTNPSSVAASDDFDLVYLDQQQRKNLWGSAAAQNEKLLKGWLSDVSGIIITFEGEPVIPFFHRLSAGATRIAGYPYLISADTSHDIENPDFLNVSVIPFSDFCSTLTAKYPDCPITPDNLEASLQILSKDNAGYVTEIIAANTSLSGEEFADIFNLPSSAFTIIYQENSLKIVTKGIGHGYGVSINHAAYLASKQYTYDEILKYFYYNIELENV